MKKRILNAVINKHRILINQIVDANNNAQNAFPEYGKPLNPYYDDFEDTYNDYCLILRQRLEKDYTSDYTDVLVEAILNKFNLPVPYKFLQ